MDVTCRVLEYALAHARRSSKYPPLENSELQLASYILDICESAEKGDFEIITEQFLSHFEDDTKDLDWNPEDEECQNINVYPDVVQLPGKPNVVQFSRGEFVELSKVEEAVAYYGSKKGFHNNGTRIRPSLSTMQRNFRFIKETHHLYKLREYETNGTVKSNRKKNLEFISTELEKDVRKHIEDGKILHDSTLRFLIADIIKRNNIDIQNFDGSDNWLNGWKRRVGISSRKITKFVAHVRHKSREQIEKDSKEFVAAANQLIPLYKPPNVFNADQSGFQLVMHTARTLAFTGSQHVHCVVQNVSSTTHSYTVLPLISAEGKLHDKLFVTLKEPNGRFPQKGHFQAPNLMVTCHSSHIMTKELMKTFFQEVMFEPNMPENALLIVDSWSSWKDQSAIDSVTPPSNKLKVLMIPPGCTGHVQPCDVGIFGAFKKVVKTITGHAQLTCNDQKIHTRDETLKLISLVWWQLCSPKLTKWAQYAWFAAGYKVDRPQQFKTPAQLLFPRGVARNCAISACSFTSFVMCLYCEECFCYNHFVTSYHKCC